MIDIIKFRNFINCTTAINETLTRKPDVHHVLRNLKLIVPIKTLYIYIYAVQQDTQRFLMIEFYSSPMLARHVSDLTSPSSGVFFTSCMCRFGMW